MAKSAEAFRTISEVAEWLGSPAHVLRFWESKFSQVKPVKRAGGRRYYRPADMLLLGGIKKLLHDDGMTIKGVQKILREQGVKYISDLSPPLEEDDVEAAALEGRASELSQPDSVPADSAQVLQFQREESASGAATSTVADTGKAARPVKDETQRSEPMPAAPEAPSPGVTETPKSDTPGQDAFAAPNTAKPPVPNLDQDAKAAESTIEDTYTAPAKAEENAAQAKKDRLTDIPGFLHRSAPLSKPNPEADGAQPEDKTAASAEPEAGRIEAEATAPPPPPRPAIIKLPPDPADDAIDAPPGLLAALAARRGRPLPADVRAAAIAQRDKLSALLSQQSGPHRE